MFRELADGQTPSVDASENLRREIQSGWPRRSSPWGTWRLLGRSRRAHVWRRFVPVVSFDDALVLYALLTLFGRHGEAAWRGQDDTGRTRAAFRAGGRQVAFRHRSQLCERPALLAHIFVRRHRPPTSGQTHPAADQSVAIMETLPVDSWVVNVIDHFLPRQLMALNVEKRCPLKCRQLWDKRTCCAGREFFAF